MSPPGGVLPAPVRKAPFGRVLTPRGSAAVMNRRSEPADSLDYFPTPPWATRALFEHVMPWIDGEVIHTAWDPACGEGHMAAVLPEYCAHTFASDVFDYGFGDVVNFLSPAALTHNTGASWIITNPPFKLALEFALQAMSLSDCGVALIVRSNWLEGEERYQRLFSRTPPTIVAHFVERVPMVKGRWDPRAKSATAYSWIVWDQSIHLPYTRTLWIPPGCRRALTRPGDYERFAAKVAAPLLEGGAA